MAKRPTITDVSSGYQSTDTVNTNFDNVQTAFDNTLSRDGSGPNEMNADLDMNSYDILNARDVSASRSLTVQGVDVADLISGVSSGTVFNTTNRFDGDGATLSFTLTKDPISRANTQVFVNGVYQQKDTYTVSGTTLTFSQAPSKGSDNIEVNIQESTSTGTPSASGVSTSDGQDVQAKLDQSHYTTRALFVADIMAGKVWADGDVVSDGTVRYIKTTGETAIGDMADWLPFGPVYPDHFGTNTSPGSTDMSSAIQAGIDYLNSGGGGELNFRGVLYQASGLRLKSRVFLVGEGRGKTIVRIVPASTNDLVTITADDSVVGWRHISFTGNLSNASGSGIVVDASTTGGDYGAESVSSNTAPDSYKHIIAYDFSVGFFTEDGINVGAGNYKTFMSKFSVAGCGNDGLAAYCSDSFFSDFYLERSGRCGLYASGSNNKFSNCKSIWSGSSDNTLGSVYAVGSYNQFVNVEAQDNYTHGISVAGVYNSFSMCASNVNGYLSVGNEDRSTRAHYDIYVKSTATGTRMQAKCWSYKTAVGSDGFWTAEKYVGFESFDVAQVAYWDVEVATPTRYNADPDFTMYGSDANGEYHRNNDGTMTTISVVQYDSDTSGTVASGALVSGTHTVPGSSLVPFVGNTAQATVNLCGASGTTSTQVQAAANFTSATQRYPTSTCYWSAVNRAAITRPLRLYLTIVGRWK